MNGSFHLDWTILLAAASGIAIAAATGLRAFMPLLALGLAGRFGLTQLDPSVSWLTADATLWALGIAAVVEILADKIPVVDHALDAVATVLRPLAGGLAAYAALAHWPHPVALAFALVAGAGAFGVHAIKAKTRIGSTALTAGAANPVLSAAEDFSAFGLAAAGILIPVIAVVLIIGAVLGVRGIARAVSRR